MNDLETLRTALLPEDPSRDVADRSRHRLQNHMLGGGRRRRVGPLAIGAGLVAAAAAAAVVVATLPGTPAPAPAPAPQAAAPVVVTGQEVLLAAATVAARQPGGHRQVLARQDDVREPDVRVLDHGRRPPVVPRREVRRPGRAARVRRPRCSWPPAT